MEGEVNLDLAAQPEDLIPHYPHLYLRERCGPGEDVRTGVAGGADLCVVKDRECWTSIEHTVLQYYDAFSYSFWLMLGDFVQLQRLVWRLE